MSSFGYYAFGAAYGSNSQMLDCTVTPHMHYYSDEIFHLKEWLHLDTLSTKGSVTKNSPARRSSLFSIHRKASHKQVIIVLIAFPLPKLTHNVLGHGLRWCDGCSVSTRSNV